MKAYFKLIKLVFMGRLAYRADLIFTFLSIILWSFAMPLFMFLVYANGATYPGWSFYELLVFLGITNIIYGVCRSLFQNFFFNFSRLIRKGLLEIKLIKPVDEIQLIAGESFEYEGVASILVGIFLLSVSVPNVNLEINVLMLILYFISSILFFLGMILVISSVVTKFIQVNRLGELLFNILEIGDQPKNVFPIFLQTLLTIVMPLFVMNFYPASALLGYEVDYPFLVILSSIIFCVLGIFIFKKSIYSYTGAGG